MYLLGDYHYALPETLIAQRPAVQRENSRLLALSRNSGRISHHRFSDICEFLSPEDVLVVNNTSVVPARLMGRKQSGGKVELLIIDYADSLEEKNPEGNQTCQCLIKAAKRPRPGTRIDFDDNLTAEVMAFQDGIFTVTFSFTGEFESLLYRIGKMPLPHYIKRAQPLAGVDDALCYQTVYASEKGAAAAPTAGLHFSEALLEKIKKRHIRIAPITLHVGYGTFVPVRVQDIRDHRMHAETYVISPESAQIINEVKAGGGRVVAVGTTSVRTLEFAAGSRNRICAGRGRSDLFIYPGYHFTMVDAMITNFHLPQSTLLMLVSAFAGRETVLAAYNEAVKEKYRFFSYGDAMFIG
ncbi:MAG: tRNA preQ1(34) S-adenosylmethionine ribosyltransferase-isomerase QueA [Pseudomonadota bacterium]